MSNDKTKHNYPCDFCEKQATVNYQTCDLRWAIVNDEIDLNSEEFLFGEDSVFYCEECEMKEGLR